MEMATKKFSDLVRPDCIIDTLEAETREDALLQMSNLLVAQGYCRASFPEAILERERVYPSGLPMRGHKIAIPHTDAEHVKRSTILFARLPRPVEFFAMGSHEEMLSIQMISMFALKEKNLIGDVLETLINVYQHHEILEEILSAPDSLEMFRVLQNALEMYGKR